MSNFAFVIYDTDTKDVVQMFSDELTCKETFDKYFNGFANMDWCGINLKFALEQLTRK